MEHNKILILSSLILLFGIARFIPNFKNKEIGEVVIIINHHSKLEVKSLDLKFKLDDKCYYVQPFLNPPASYYEVPCG